MKFALFHHVPWPQGHTHAQVFAETTEQIQLAEALGFHAAWLAEHHFSRYGLASASLMLATHLAAHTSRIRLGTAVTIAPIRHPLHLAEETATLDVLSNGRLDFGVGSGGPVELDGFRISKNESRERMKEIVDIIKGLWVAPVYSHKGSFYEVQNVALSPRPIQQPHPPIYAAVRNLESVHAAVERDLQFMTGVIPDTNVALQQRQAYIDIARQAGKRPNSDNLPFFRYVYVGESEEQVREDTEGPMQWVWECIDWQDARAEGRGGSLDDWMANDRHSKTRYEDFYANRAFFGTPDRVLEQIRGLRDHHGITYFGGNFSFGGIEQAKSLRSLNLFAREVAAKL